MPMLVFFIILGCSLFFLSLGVAFLVQGNRIRRRYSIWSRLPGKLIQTKASLGATIQVEWQRQVYSSTALETYSLRTKEEVNVLFDPSTGRIELDNWTRNGKMVQMTGILMCITSVLVAAGLAFTYFSMI